MASPGPVSRHLRPAGLATTMWLFGLATTVVLLALWGRALVADQETVVESANAVVADGFVEERLEVWLGDVLTETTGLGGDRATQAAARIVADPAVAGAIDELVGDVVVGVLDPSATEVVIDPGELAGPVVPVVVEALAAEGIVLEAGDLLTAASSSPDVVLAADALEDASSAVAGSRAALSIAVVAGSVLMALAGGSAVVLAEDRVRQLRVLGSRILVSGLTFAVLLRVGAWAVDPAGGRSPVADLLTAQLWVPLAVAAVGGAVGVIAWTQRRPMPAAGPDTEERVLVEA